MVRAQWRPLLLLGAWSAVMAASVFVALRGPGRILLTGDAIASVVAATGKVQVRDSHSPLWTDTFVGQHLPVGSVVATAAKATAMVRFSSGHELKIEPKSQVIIEHQTSGDHDDFVVTLVKGAVDTKATPTDLQSSSDVRRLAIKVGKEKLIIRGGTRDHARVVREPRASAARVVILNGHLKAENISTGKVRGFTAPASEPVLASSSKVPSKARANRASASPPARDPASLPLYYLGEAPPALVRASKSASDIGDPALAVVPEQDFARVDDETRAGQSPRSTKHGSRVAMSSAAAGQEPQQATTFARPAARHSKRQPSRAGSGAPKFSSAPAQAPRSSSKTSVSNHAGGSRRPVKIATAADAGDSESAPPLRKHHDHAPAPSRLPRFIAPSQDLTVWTESPISASAKVKVQVIMELPHGAASAQAELEVLRPRLASTKLPLRRDPTSNQYVSQLEIDSAETLKIRPSLAIGKEKAAPAVPERTVNVRSLSELRSAADIAVMANDFGYRSGKSPILSLASLRPAEAALQVHLRRGQDLVAMAPLLRGSSALSIQLDPPPAPHLGWHVLRNNERLATLSGKAASKSMVVQMTEALLANLAFEGDVGSFHASLPSSAPEAKIYIITKDERRVDLRTSLVRSSSLAGDLAVAHGKAFFTAEPRDLWPKPRPAVDGVPPGLTAWHARSGKAKPAQRVVFLESSPEQGTAGSVRFDERAFDALGLFSAAKPRRSSTHKAPSKAETQLSNQLGLLSVSLEPEGSSADGLEHGPAASAAPHVPGVDLTVQATTANLWRVSTSSGGRSKVIAEAPPPATRHSALALHHWLLDTLGYDGVVIEGDGPYTLAACSGSRGAIGKQGASARGVFEVIANQGGYCILRTLLGRAPPIGAKLRFY